MSIAAKIDLVFANERILLIRFVGSLVRINFIELFVIGVALVDETLLMAELDELLQSFENNLPVCLQHGEFVGYSETPIGHHGHQIESYVLELFPRGHSQTIGYDASKLLGPFFVFLPRSVIHRVRFQAVQLEEPTIYRYVTYKVKSLAGKSTRRYSRIFVLSTLRLRHRVRIVSAGQFRRITDRPSFVLRAHTRRVHF